MRDKLAMLDLHQGQDMDGRLHNFFKKMALPNQQSLWPYRLKLDIDPDHSERSLTPAHECCKVLAV